MADLGKKKSNNSLRTSNRIQSPSPIAIPTTAQAVVTKSGGGGDNLQRKKSHEILKSHQQKFNLHGKERGSGAVLHTPDVDLNGKNVRNGEREDGNEDEEEDNLVRKRIRVRRGMRRDSFENAQNSISTQDSCFELQEHLNYLLRHRHDIETLVRLPHIAREDGQSLWIYEHLRSITKDINTPWITLLQDQCKCPEMRANEATFVCVSHSAHRRSKCSALDYSIHNLNSISNDLNLSATSFDTQKLVLRKLSRIVSHVYAHHRDLFLVCESETYLAGRIARLAKEYSILPSYILIWDEGEKEELADDFGPRRAGSAPSRQLIDVGPVSNSEESDSDESNSDDD